MGAMISRAVVLGLLVLGATPVLAQTDRFVPFTEFLDTLSNAQAADHVGGRSSLIARAEDFTEMKEHALRLYAAVSARHSFLLDGQYFDCIPIGDQPSVRLQGLKSVASPPPPPPSMAAPSTSALAATQLDLEQRLDRFGNAVGCQVGTIPMRRITLEELQRFRNLREFLQKGPDGAGQAGKQGRALTHLYAHAWQPVQNNGGSSRLNLWNPYVSPAQVFSLSQHWYVSRPGGVTQTVEGGWQHYPGKYGATSKSVLFIYWTADSYTRTGCYNLDCAGFVQTNNNIRLGGGFSRYSTVGGAQYELWLQWFRSGGNWWMYLGGTAVGYYPASLWANTGLARGATTIDYGGETTGDGNYPAMGSGRFAAAGAKQAAYQQLVEYFDTGNKRRIASLSPDQRTPRCYTINLRNNSPTASKTYFYYGGPGGRVC